MLYRLRVHPEVYQFLEFEVVQEEVEVVVQEEQAPLPQEFQVEMQHREALQQSNYTHTMIELNDIRKSYTVGEEELFVLS